MWLRCGASLSASQACGSTRVGAVFIVWVDAASRAVLAPKELPDAPGPSPLASCTSGEQVRSGPRQSKASREQLGIDGPGARRFPCHGAKQQLCLIPPLQPAQRACPRDPGRVR